MAKKYSEEDLKKFVNNIDHDGFNVGEEKRYFKSVWDKLPNLRW